MEGVLYLNLIVVTRSYVILDKHIVENETVTSLVPLKKKLLIKDLCFFKLCCKNCLQLIVFLVSFSV